MILADKIINERKRNGWSQEELAEKLAVSRQSVSKWESAQSVPDLQRIIQMATIFGVSTDYLLKDEIEDIPLEGELKEYVGGEISTIITMEEANEFLDIRRSTSSKLSGAVACCILSPILLLVLLGVAESGKGGISQELATGIGLTVLLLIVAFSVYVFIMIGMKRKKYEFLEKENFETAYGVTGMVKEMKKDFESRYASELAIGIILCILSPLPVILGTLLYKSDILTIMSVGVLLTLVSAGVYMIISVADINESYQILLQEEDFKASEKRVKKVSDKIGGIYWGAMYCNIFRI